MKLDAKGLYIVLFVIVGMAVAVLGLGVYAASSLLEGRAKSVYDARQHSLVLSEKQRQLSKARSDVAKYKALADIAKSIVPQDKDQAQTVREIVGIAQANHIKLGSITFPTSSLGDPKGAKSQLKPEKGIPGVYSLEIAVQSDVSTQPTFADFINFLDDLEHNRRTALVGSIALQPDVNRPERLSFTLTLNEYIKP